MNGERIEADIAIVGAGPAGIAAALAASERGARVALIDMMDEAGGRIWAGGAAHGGTRRQHAMDTLEARGVRHLRGVRAIAGAPQRLLLEGARDACVVHFERLILATGARELQLPFPGWTLPGVVAAGGLQLMVKSGLRLEGKRVVIAGTGPLLLAAADTARRAGAQVACIAEQAPFDRLLRFALQLPRFPDRLLQALRLRAALARTPYRSGLRLHEALADEQGWVRQVTLTDARGHLQHHDCDLLAVGHSLVPELQLPALLGCRLRDDGQAVAIDAFGATSQPGLYAAGESTGFGGWRKAWIEGRIAGLAAAGRREDAEPLLPQADKERRYAALLQQAFAPRCDESPAMTPETIVCRCEDVPLWRLADCGSWREARLQQRCGMGYCQGRLCGGALALHRGWRTGADTRIPIVPARLDTFIHLAQLTTGDSA